MISRVCRVVGVTAACMFMAPLTCNFINDQRFEISSLSKPTLVVAGAIHIRPSATGELEVNVNSPATAAKR